jgi:NAD(P)-dependent dehydrogenase (short-subunit alcohol dehydrogenase family)
MQDTKDARKMKQFQGGTAIVTGGASGIGLSLARRLGQGGMRIMLLDVEEQALALAVEELRGRQIKAEAMACDVADAAAVQGAVDETAQRLGPLQIVCNNAGVGAGGPFEQVPLEDWHWVLGVNLMGVVHGTRAAIPHMKAHGRPSWIVNTASMAGMAGVAQMAPYCASKFAVVAMSEALRQELAESNIGVSVLCPGWVRTRIQDSRRNHPNPAAPAAATDPERVEAMRQLLAQGLRPDLVAERVVEAIEADELYIFTDIGMAGLVHERSQAIAAALDAARHSTVLKPGR